MKMFEVRNQGKKQILYHTVETNLYTYWSFPLRFPLIVGWSDYIDYFVCLQDINIVMGHIFTSDFRKV